MVDADDRDRLSWSRQPHMPAGMRAFSVHRRGGSALMSGVLAAVALFETGVVHLFLLHWSARVAWPVFVLDCYGVLWMVAQARALVLRPIVVGPDRLVIRMGLVWTLSIDRSLVADARAFAGPRPSRRSTDPLPVCSLNSPTVFLRLREPVTANRVWSVRKQVTSLAVAVDDPAELIRLLGCDGV